LHLSSQEYSEVSVLKGMASSVGIQGVAKTFAKINAKTSKHHIPLLPLWSNGLKLNKHKFKMFDQRITFS
jgi:hypothetical protein